MKDRETYFTDLIIRYLSKEASEEEIREMKEWLNAGPENRKLFTDLRKTWVLLEEAKLETGLIVEAELERMKERMEASRLSAFSSQSSAERSKEKDPISLVSVNRMRFSFALTRVMKIAAIFLLFAVPSFLLYRYLSEARDIEFVASEGMIEVILPDGTSVALNKGSSIHYPEEFQKDLREVRLQGEAYFNVKHLPGSKFLIRAGKVQIEDIGTAFYVNTQKSDNAMEVVLTEGKAAVSFSDKSDGRVVIVPGEKAEVNLSGGRIEKTVNEDMNFLAWKTRRLVFSGNTLAEVADLLNRVYSSDIRIIGENIKNCRLTAIFDNQSLESVLNVIKSTLDVSVTLNGSVIEISGDSCSAK